MINECDDYLTAFASNGHPADFTPPTEPLHITICRQMIDAVLHSRKPDNGASDAEPINHDGVRLMAQFFQAYLDIIVRGPLRPKDIGAFHVLYGVCRILVNAGKGNVLYDKIVDVGGWATVMADAADL